MSERAKRIFVRSAAWSFVLVMWGTIGYLFLMNHYRLQGEHEGYERGAYQGAVYQACMGKPPSKHFREQMWNLVNLPNDCRYIQAVERAGLPAEKP